MFRNLSPVVRALLYANFIVYALQRLTAYGPWLEYQFALWPLGFAPTPYNGSFEPWQLVTYAFLHDPRTFLHIFGNMLALYMFGPDVERLLGSRRFAVYYFVCVVGAALTQLAVEHAASQPFQTLGASGGIFGILLLFGLAFPRRMILIYFAFPMPAWLFVVLYGLLEFWFGVFGSMQDVAHFAHLGGMAAGAALILYWRGRIRPSRR
jgi:membrane associated rhomboid family serine protease